MRIWRKKQTKLITFWDLFKFSWHVENIERESRKMYYFSSSIRFSIKKNEKRKEFSSGEEKKIIENEHLMEVFISFSNVESSCFSSAMSFRMRETCDAARENLPSAHFSSMWWWIFTYLCSHLARRRRIFHVMMVKVSSFPLRSVVSISWSEIVQLIRVCSRFIKAICSKTAEFCLENNF